VQEFLGGLQDVQDTINIHVRIEWVGVESEGCETFKMWGGADGKGPRGNDEVCKPRAWEESFRESGEFRKRIRRFGRILFVMYFQPFQERGSYAFTN
jgi:hypothetical protein